MAGEVAGRGTSTSQPIAGGGSGGRLDRLTVPSALFSASIKGGQHRVDQEGAAGRWSRPTRTIHLKTPQPIPGLPAQHVLYLALSARQIQSDKTQTQPSQASLAVLTDSPNHTEDRVNVPIVSASLELESAEIGGQRRVGREGVEVEPSRGGGGKQDSRVEERGGEGGVQLADARENLHERTSEVGNERRVGARGRMTRTAPSLECNPFIGISRSGGLSARVMIRRWSSMGSLAKPEGRRRS